MQALTALMWSDNAGITGGTDVIWPQRSFVATCLCYSQWKMDKMDQRRQKKGQLLTWEVWKTETGMEDRKMDESILPVFKCEPDIWDEKP